MKRISLLIAFVMASITVFGQTTWTLDPNHSKLGFTVTHLGIADIPGHFNDYTVEITTSKEDFSDAVVELTVQTSSVDTRISARDEHLRSPDFFNVEKFPTLTFKSTSIKKTGDQVYELTGDLTLLGKTKPVTVTMNHRGTIPNPMAEGAPVAGIQIIGEFKRSDFGFGESFPAPLLSDVVFIKGDGEFAIKKEASSN